MKRISKKILSILIIIVICLMASCQSGGKKSVKLTSENWVDYLNIEPSDKYSLTSNEDVKEVYFNITSKNEVYIFEEVDGIIYYTYDICYNGETARYTDGSSGSNNTGSAVFELDRLGHGKTNTGLNNDQNHDLYIPDTKTMRIENLRVSKVEFKSGTVRKNDLAD